MKDVFLLFYDLEKIGDRFRYIPHYGPVYGSGNKVFRTKKLAVIEARKRPFIDGQDRRH